MQYLYYFCTTNKKEIKMFRKLYILTIILIVTINSSCTKKNTQTYTPWGESLSDSLKTSDETFSFSDIQNNGELIMLTISGPDTYFTYHGRNMGTQYLLCEKFAQRLGVSLRVELCKSTKELTQRLKNGDADIVAYPIHDTSLIACGYKSDKDSKAWAVNKTNKELADSLDKWYSPKVLEEIKNEEKTLFANPMVHRHVYAPMLNAKNGTISQYDHLFIRYAPITRWDWRLLAAQCYQESCFDSNAYSWAGAKGLMQIMPATARHLGLPENKILDPEQNIYAAARYIAELSNHFNDIRNPIERQLFVLASYNGGYFHIRDAMRLAEKHGKNKYKWDDVATFVLNLQREEFYNDDVVRYGYMRGTETVDYVSKIKERWRQYCGKSRGHIEPFSSGIYPSDNTPRRATKKHRFHL